MEQAAVWLGTQPTVPLVATRDVVMTLPHGWRTRVHFGVDYQAPVAAPVAAGQVLGALVLTNPGLPDIRMQLVAGQAVPRLGLLARASTVLGQKLGRH